MTGGPLRAGHGTTPWHCSCHGVEHPIPSLAADCEDRTTTSTTDEKEPH